MNTTSTKKIEGTSKFENKGTTKKKEKEYGARQREKKRGRKDSDKRIASLHE